MTSAARSHQGGLPARIHRHVLALWPPRCMWVPITLLLWPIAFIATGFGRWEHALLLIAVPSLAFGNAGSKRMFVGLVPMGFLGLVYDTMRWVKDVGLTESRIHICDLRAIDMAIASVSIGGVRGSVHDWLQQHPSTVLDLVSAVPYGTFLFVTCGFAILLYLRDYALMRLFGWAFLVVNLMGFVTYHLYPAAPPWYFHAHGCAVDLTARASEGAALARVDALLGVPYFHGFYARSSDVFGAVPSLHVSYPTLMVLFGWPVLGWIGRAGSVLFLLTMCVGAVYLDHHWLFDVILGFVYAVVGSAAVVALSRATALPHASEIAS